MADEYINMSDATTITLNTTDPLDINHHYGHTIDISSITTSSAGYIDAEGIKSITDDLISMDGDFSITLSEPVEFEDTMPDVSKIEDMCNDYPALAQAYEKFKTIYAMVHQDWKGKQDDDNDKFPF